MTRTIIAPFGHSQNIGRELGSDMGLAAAVPGVLLVDRIASASLPLTFVDDPLRALSPRTVSVAGLPIGTAGPELQYGRRLEAVRPGGYGIAKMAVDGSSWEDEWMNPTFPSGGPQLLAQWFTYCDAQAAAMGGVVDIVVPFLGEADANESPDTANALTNMRAWRTAVRAHWPNVGIVMYRLPTTFAGGGTAAVYAAVNTFVAETSRCRLADMDGIPTSDGAHFTSAGVVTCGDRIADAIMGVTPDLNTIPFDILTSINLTSGTFDVLIGGAPVVNLAGQIQDGDDTMSGTISIPPPVPVVRPVGLSANGFTDLSITCDVIS